MLYALADRERRAERLMTRRRDRRPLPRSVPITERSLALATAVLIVALLLVAAHASVRLVQVTGNSMSPTAPDGTILLVSTVQPVSRGDIVVVRDPGGWMETDPDSVAVAQDDAAPSGEYLVKRVIAVGGDRLICCDRTTGGLSLNGEALDEPYLVGAAAGTRGFDVRVPDDHVWLLGDNRPSSLDSRRHLGNGDAGALPLADILGVAWAPPW